MADEETQKKIDDAEALLNEVKEETSSGENPEEQKEGEEPKPEDPAPDKSDEDLKESLKAFEDGSIF